MAQLDTSVSPSDGPTEGKITVSKGVAEPVPLNSSLRVQPIHAAVPEVRVPVHAASKPSADVTDAKFEDVGQKASSILHPVTLQPFSVDELRSHNLESLLRQCPNAEAADKAREEAARELRKLIDENERKSKEIEREMEEKEKTREIERKVYNRKLGKDG